MKQGNSKLERVDMGWDQMSVLLDAEMPRKRKRYFLIILFLGIGILGFVAFSGIWDTSQSNKTEGYAKSGSSAINQDSDTRTDSPAFETTLNQSKPADKEGDIKSNLTFGKGQFDHLEVAQKDPQYKNKDLMLDANKVNPPEETAPNPETTTSKSLEGLTATHSTSKSLALHASNSKAGMSSSPLDDKHAAIIENPQNSSSANIPAEKNQVSLQYIESKQYTLRRPTIDIPIDPAFAETDPITVSSRRTPLLFSAGVIGEYIPDFTSFGYGPSISLEKPLGQKWGIRLGASYLFNTRDPSSGTAANEADSQDVPSGQMGSPESYIELLDQNTDTLNTLALTLSAYYKLSRRVSISSGFGASLYNKHLGLSMDRFAQLGSNLQLNSVELQPGSRWVTSINTGLLWHFTGRARLEVSYNHALNDFYRDGNAVLNVHKISGAVYYSF